MLEHTDILNSHYYIHESKLRIGILLGIPASAKEEATSFLAVALGRETREDNVRRRAPSYLK
jgi:hypothetical protein